MPTSEHSAGDPQPLRLSVVVPATDRPATLDRCLRAIRAARSGPDEVIVVDRPYGLGPAAARNLGVAGCSGDVVAFVDADVEVHPDAFQRIRAALAETPELTGVFGSYDDEPAVRDTVSVFRNLLHHHVHQEGAGRASTFWAGLGAIRRERFLAVGGFDGMRYPTPSIEDIELGARLAADGAVLRLDPALQGKHLKRWTLIGMLRTDLVARGVPWVRLLLERGTSSSALNLGLKHRLSALAALGVVSGVMARRARLTTCSLAALIGLNARFYLLLTRKLGPAKACVGVGLHVVHQLTAVAAFVVGLVLHVRPPSSRLRSIGVEGSVDAGDARPGVRSRLRAVRHRHRPRR
jgi:Glycosyl transferase family 2